MHVSAVVLSYGCPLCAVYVSCLPQAGALRALLHTAATPEAPAPGGRSSSGGGGGGESGSPVKIALFSLGNMATHRECREVLLQLGIREVLRNLASSPDPTLQRYIARVQQKLVGGGNGAAGPPPAGRG
jgi:hypothetical protein